MPATISTRARATTRRDRRTKVVDEGIAEKPLRTRALDGSVAPARGDRAATFDKEGAGARTNSSTAGKTTSGVLTDPASLPPGERAAWMRQALLADHADVAKHNPAGLQAKLEKLTTSPFVFFRGTAGLFYRELAHVDADKPQVLLNGDVHPENFGIMRSRDGELFFGPNDFDESTRGPFTWDLRRGAVAFLLAGRESGLSKKEQKKLVEGFVEAYADTLKKFSRGDDEADYRVNAKNCPDVLKDLFDEAEGVTRKKFLKQRVDTDRGEFIPSDEIERAPELVKLMQRALQQAKDADGKSLIKGLADADVGSLTVKDVAKKTGSGTASVGLDRYWLLLEGKKSSGKDDIIVELKLEQASIIDRVRPRKAGSLKTSWDRGDHAARVAKAHQVQVAEGDPFFGSTKLHGQSFLVRERIPEKISVELKDLSDKELIAYGKACGHALAAAHARSDEDGGLAGTDIEKTLKEAFSHLDLDKGYEWARAAADRVEQDHAALVDSLLAGELP